VTTRPDAQSFDASAATFVRLREITKDLGSFTPWLREQLPGGRRALDLGCGAGEHALLLAEAYEKVLAVDLSAPMLAFAPAHERIAYEARDLFDVRGEFDLVLTVNTLHHVEVRAALAHIGTLVAPGGTAIVVDLLRRLPAFVWKKPTLRAFAALDLAVDLLHRSPTAWERFRLQNRREWIDHLRTDRFPTMADWQAAFEAELPGAHVQEVTRLMVATWRRTD
jgi:SAM-dependent methyltransferase